MWYCSSEALFTNCKTFQGPGNFFIISWYRKPWNSIGCPNFFTWLYMPIYMPTYLHVYSSVYLSIYPSIYLPIYPPVYPSIHILPILLSIHLSTHHPSIHVSLPIHLSIYPSISSTYLSIHPSIYLLICLSIHPSICSEGEHFLIVNIKPWQENLMYKKHFLAVLTGCCSALTYSVSSSRSFLLCVRWAVDKPLPAAAPEGPGLSHCSPGVLQTHSSSGPAGALQELRQLERESTAVFGVTGRVGGAGETRVRRGYEWTLRTRKLPPMTPPALRPRAERPALFQLHRRLQDSWEGARPQWW